MKAATIYDVARLAGVSHQTVSRYLSGFEGIRPETRSKVETALAELDYRPNAAARLLRTRRTNRIGVLADRVDQTGPARIIAAATRTAQEHGYLLDVVMTDGLDPESIGAAFSIVTEHQVVGILATAQTDLVVEYLQRFAPPVPLVIDARLPLYPGGAPMNDFAGTLAADHLLDLGHRRVGYLSGPTAWIAASGRLDGFRNRIEERGGTVVWTREGDWSATSGHDAWRSLDPEERDVTAVATGNDSMAIGLISAAHADGVSVPEDLSVIGNDDFDEAQYTLPALTTVAVDFEGEGRLLVEDLIFRVQGIEESPAPAAPPRLVVRDSTRALDTSR